MKSKWYIKSQSTISSIISQSTMSQSTISSHLISFISHLRNRRDVRFETDMGWKERKERWDQYFTTISSIYHICLTIYHLIISSHLSSPIDLETAKTPYKYSKIWDEMRWDGMVDHEREKINHLISHNLPSLLIYHLTIYHLIYHLLSKPQLSISQNIKHDHLKKQRWDGRWDGKNYLIIYHLIISSLHISSSTISFYPDLEFFLLHQVYLAYDHH